MRRLFEQAGFEIRSIRWLEGDFGTVAYQFQQTHRRLPRDARRLPAHQPGG